MAGNNFASSLYILSAYRTFQRHQQTLNVFRCRKLFIRNFYFWMGCVSCYAAN